jgi:hypothetical protein
MKEFSVKRKLKNGSPINILKNGFHYIQQSDFFSDRPYAEALAGIIKMKLCKRF